MGELEYRSLTAAAALRGGAEEIPGGVHEQVRVGIGAIGPAAEAVQNALLAGGVDHVQGPEVEGSGCRCGSV